MQALVFLASIYPTPLTGAKDISSSLGVLSSMLTPAVLIMVCGSLILATSNRLTRLIDRTRKLYDQHKAALKKGNDTVAELIEEREMLKRLLPLMIKRVRFMQIALTSLYLALTFFVLTSVLIGIFEIAKLNYTWIPLGIGMIGAGLLFHSTLMLLSETRIGLKTVYYEMDRIAGFLRPAEEKHTE
jgi:hypothetical protein